MTLKAKPRNTAVPFILDIYDADQPEGSPRVVARYDTRNGQLWRTSPTTKPPLALIREAVEHFTA